MCKKSQVESSSESDVSLVSFHSDDSDYETNTTNASLNYQKNLNTATAAVGAAKRSATGTSSDFGSIDRHHKKRSLGNTIDKADINTNDDNSIQEVDNGPVPPVLQLPKNADDIVFDLDVDVGTSLYNTFPPGMQYRVLSENNSSENDVGSDHILQV